MENQDPQQNTTQPIDQPINNSAEKPAKAKARISPILTIGIVALVGIIAFYFVAFKLIGSIYTMLGIYKDNSPKISLAPSPTPTPTSDLNREPTGSAATSTWKTYTNVKYGFSFQYPPSLKLSTEKALSRTVPNTTVEWITLSGENSHIKFSFEPNQSGSTVADWLLQRKQNWVGEPEPIEIASRKGILRNSADVANTVNIFLPFNNTTVLWASDWWTSGSTDLPETKKELVQILQTFKFTNQKE